MATVSLADIPTLTTLYQSDSLKPSPSPVVDNPSTSVNDRVGLIRGDITKLRLDAIVNAANPPLIAGGGVDGAIHHAAGAQLQAECNTLGGCPTGKAKITAGYRLPARRVIHTVGPRYNVLAPDPNSENLLRNCYEETLKLAVEKGVRTLAFSGISTGIYGFPNKEASEVACAAVRKFLDGEDGEKLTRVVFVTFVDKDVAAYNETLPKYFPPEGTKQSSD